MPFKLLASESGAAKTVLVLTVVIACVIGLALVRRGRPQPLVRGPETASQTASHVANSAAADSESTSASGDSSRSVPRPESRAPAASSALTASEQGRMSILNEVLVSRNDNDPRLDRDLKNLTPAMKRALESQYQQTRAESRNARGTIAFLLGRELKTPEDVKFLENVLSENSCLSLQDCARRPSTRVEDHAAMADETTLVYPQLVALRSLKALLDAPASADLVPAAVAALRAGAKSDSPKVASAARDLLTEP